MSEAESLKYKLFIACRHDLSDEVQKLIKQYPYLKKARDNNGCTLLHLACDYSSPDVLKYLIEEQGFDKEATDNDGRTPLHLACVNDNQSIVEYLIEQQNVNKEAKDNNDRTPLHLACANGCLEVVQYLIEKQKVTKEAKDKDNKTPLHIACQNGHLDIVKYLIEQDANIRATDNDNHTPLDYLDEGERKIIDGYLKEKQKKENKKEEEKKDEETKPEEEQTKNESKKEEEHKDEEHESESSKKHEPNPSKKEEEKKEEEQQTDKEPKEDKENKEEEHKDENKKDEEDKKEEEKKEEEHKDEEHESESSKEEPKKEEETKEEPKSPKSSIDKHKDEKHKDEKHESESSTEEIKKEETKEETNESDESKKEDEHKDKDKKDEETKHESESSSPKHSSEKHESESSTDEHKEETKKEDESQSPKKQTQQEQTQPPQPKSQNLLTILKTFETPLTNSNETTNPTETKEQKTRTFFDLIFKDSFTPITSPTTPIIPSTTQTGTPISPSTLPKEEKEENCFAIPIFIPYDERLSTTVTPTEQSPSMSLTSYEQFQALQYCSQLNAIIHHDVKPKDVLISPTPTLTAIPTIQPPEDFKLIIPNNNKEETSQDIVIDLTEIMKTQQDKTKEQNESLMEFITQKIIKEKNPEEDKTAPTTFEEVFYNHPFTLSFNTPPQKANGTEQSSREIKTQFKAIKNAQEFTDHLESNTNDLVDSINKVKKAVTIKKQNNEKPSKDGEAKPEQQPHELTDAEKEKVAEFCVPIVLNNQKQETITEEKKENKLEKNIQEIKRWLKFFEFKINHHTTNIENLNNSQGEPIDEGIREALIACHVSMLKIYNLAYGLTNNVLAQLSRETDLNIQTEIVNKFGIILDSIIKEVNSRTKTPQAELVEASGVKENVEILVQNQELNMTLGKLENAGEKLPQTEQKEHEI